MVKAQLSGARSGPLHGGRRAAWQLSVIGGATASAAALPWSTAFCERLARSEAVRPLCERASCRHNRGESIAHARHQVHGPQRTHAFVEALSATPTQALVSDAASTITTPCNRPCRLQVSHQRVRPEPIARKANLKSDCLESKACRPAVSRTSGTGPTTAQHQRTNDCLPCQPFSSSLPGKSHSIRCHCSPVNARRIKIVLPGYDLESTFGIREDLALTSTRPSVSLVSLLRRSA
jgi:hypothetical protein